LALCSGKVVITEGIAGSSWQDVEKPVQLQQRLTNRQLMAKNADYAFAIFVVYTLSLSIFPGFLSEDTGQHHLGSW
jgi:equilibrative nucleoside transporter 1/2/3